MSSYKVIVEDMHCNNCAKKIKDAFAAKNVACNVNLAKKEVEIDDMDVAEIYATIEDAGFTPTDCEIL